MFDIKEKFLKKKVDYLNHIVYPVSTHGILNFKKVRIVLIQLSRKAFLKE